MPKYNDIVEITKKLCAKLRPFNAKLVYTFKDYDDIKEIKIMDMSVRPTKTFIFTPCKFNDLENIIDNFIKQKQFSNQEYLWQRRKKVAALKSANIFKQLN